MINKVTILTPKEFAKKMCVPIVKTDMYILAVFSGFPGSGKSCLSSQITEEYALGMKTPFTYKDNITFLRDELKTWIDGNGEENKGQKPEKSGLLCDELISMFFNRNWNEEGQREGIELLNKCRDRHHLISGNIPVFWQLDSGARVLVTFWIHVYEKGHIDKETGEINPGKAIVYKPSDNEWNPDPWNQKINYKLGQKGRNSLRQSENYVCDIYFHDWPENKKNEYYQVRNTKRKGTEGQKKKVEKYSKIKLQRNNCIIALKQQNPKLTNKEIAEIVGNISADYVGKVLLGVR